MWNVLETLYFFSLSHRGKRPFYVHVIFALVNLGLSYLTSLYVKMLFKREDEREVQMRARKLLGEEELLPGRSSSYLKHTDHIKKPRLGGWGWNEWLAMAGFHLFPRPLRIL